MMASSKPRNSDLSSSSSSSRSRRASSSCTKAQQFDQTHTTKSNVPSSSTVSTMTVDGILRNVYPNSSSESTLLDAQITLIDKASPLPTPPSPQPPTIEPNSDNNNQDTINTVPSAAKTVDDVWREIVAGRKELKEEPDEMMTLEDFLVKAGAVEVGDEEDEIKMPPPERLSGGLYAFDPVPPSAFQVLDKVEGSIIGFDNGLEAVAGGVGGRGKRGRAPVLEPLDKAAQQRQRRMIKNRESAARSRERKQAYQVELESLAVRLEEENERLMKEKEERTKERLKQLMEKVVPVVENRRPPRVLRRVRSLQW